MESIAAEKTMSTKLPKISCSANRGTLPVTAVNLIICIWLRVFAHLAVDVQVDLARRKSGQLNVNVTIENFYKAFSQQVQIPRRLFG